MRPVVAAAVVFGTSAAVLVLEILAGRLLAPHVGVTLETYTGIIGTVLAGISLGTWLGGRAADQADPRRLLAPLLAVGRVVGGQPGRGQTPAPRPGSDGPRRRAAVGHRDGRRHRRDVPDRVRAH